ncbi:hypothetical protein [Xenorhabdus mauleonii]|uniref:hypothetical protein n=1 Tax=Xenorhabdus mauleonii TaxID=351675 RepID=UPI0014733BB4|nr:hypothetical protein [Xenorhabdus mauleonii]
MTPLQVREREKINEIPEAAAQASDHRERARTGEDSTLIFERSDVAFVTENACQSKK